MPTYTPPLRDMQFVMHELLHVTDTYKTLPNHVDVDEDTLNQVVEEGGKFCADVLMPINQSGDQEGCTYDAVSHAVKTPKGFKEAYQQFRDGGWTGLSAAPTHGGQGLPHLLQIAFYEMQYSTNQAWSMYPGLTSGAYECLARHATPEQQALYCTKLVSGEWMGTMCLTEPHCGTDLGMIKTRAVPTAEGSYQISGNKIFISSGDHDLTENIVHLVLARMPDAPAGTKGISLFIVPKFLPDANGKPGAKNGIYCGGIEHKMGIRGSATCQMVLENATGFLVGQANKGLAAMFVMMNGARLGVGIQGLGINEIAYQQSLAYAKDRLQSRSLSGPKAPDKAADPIIVHPDVRRMLLTQKAYVEGGRAFGYWLALQNDLVHSAPTPEARAQAEDMMALMTPVLKAFMTDNGFQCASLAMQVLGGHGYIREWGVEQHVRDARINMIYEGTNGVQALDLLARKVLSDNGAKLKEFGKMVQALVLANSNNAAMKEFIEPLMDIADKVQKLTMEIGMKAMANPEEAGAAATDYLRVMGHFVYAYFWARMAQVALEKQKAGATETATFYQAKLETARFYFARLLPETAFHIRAARSGAANLMTLPANLFLKNSQMPKTPRANRNACF